MNDNLFHNHLDVCTQCRNNPMLLCPEGSRRLEQQVTGTDPGVPPPRPPELDPMAAFDSMFDAIFGRSSL
jgi:hypothetical protein